MSRSSSLWLVSFLLVVALVLVSSSDIDIGIDIDIDIECDLYIAESTVPNAGLGVFTATAREPGESIGNGDVCIPQIDIDWHHGAEDIDNFADFVWEGTVLGMGTEVGIFELVHAFCPGLDAATNSHGALVNVDVGLPLFDEGGLHRSKDPGVGAFSAYHNGTSSVKSRIPQGGELFKSYGDAWFDNREGMLGPIPVKPDIQMAEWLLGRFDQLVPSHSQSAVFDLLMDLRQVWPKALPMRALPPTLDQFQTAIDDSIRAVHQPNATRSLEWLKQHGTCIDHIIPGPSTLPNAGHGAFAKRRLPKDIIITASPLIHVWNKTLVEMYDISPGENGNYERKGIIGRQLFLNYCFGSEESTLLLCPYGSGVNYINHNQALANVKIVWAKDGKSNHDSRWLDKTPDEMKGEYVPHLGINYVAIRDVKQGEELFLDYGDAWERAWQEHVKDWNPPNEWTEYVSADAWNRQLEPTVLLRSEVEQQSNPYPSNLEIRCHSNMVMDKYWRTKPLSWDHAGPAKEGTAPEYGHPCRITHGHANNTYNVEVSVITDLATGNEVKYVRNRVPRGGIAFFDRPHTTDMHLSMAFRHHIELPSRMLPEAWKNLELEESSFALPPDTSPPESSSCELFMAPSTIPGAGLGIFTAKDLEEGDFVGNGDVPILLVDVSRHQGFPDNHHYYDSDFFDPFQNYVWDGGYMGIGNQEYVDNSVFWPGINAGVNCFPSLINIGLSMFESEEAGIHRSRHPGAGAFSPYHNGTSPATRRIPAGGELFKDYGDDWFTSRGDFDGMPLVGSFDDANELLEDFNLLDGKSEDLYRILVEICSIWNAGLGNALPKSYEDALIATKEDIGVLHQPNATRDLEWLQEHGKCMDHIIPGRSTIENAGHGAFAKRFLPAGTVITGSPLLLTFRNYTDMYNFEKVSDNKVLRHERIGSQLLLNYCYGHRYSTLLLCPYGSGVNYINHNKTLVNVKIQWAANGTTAHNSSWLSMSPSEIIWNHGSNLGFDFIATKAIQQGEELFLDYGDEWEQAWLEYAAAWQPHQEWSSYVSAAEWNKLMTELPLRTQSEQIKDPYPNNLSLHCHSDLVDDDWMDGELSWEVGYPVHRCEVLSRDSKNVTYDVILTIVDVDKGSTTTLRREDVPRNAINFVDLPYTTDMHLKTVFRHELGIPEETFPNAWRDASQDASGENGGSSIVANVTASLSADYLSEEL